MPAFIDQQIANRLTSSLRKHSGERGERGRNDRHHQAQRIQRQLRQGSIHALAREPVTRQTQVSGHLVRVGLKKCPVHLQRGKKHLFPRSQPTINAPRGDAFAMLLFQLHIDPACPEFLHRFAQLFLSILSCMEKMGEITECR